MRNICLRCLWMDVLLFALSFWLQLRAVSDFTNGIAKLLKATRSVDMARAELPVVTLNSRSPSYLKRLFEKMSASMITNERTSRSLKICILSEFGKHEQGRAELLRSTPVGDRKHGGCTAVAALLAARLAPRRLPVLPSKPMRRSVFSQHNSRVLNNICRHRNVSKLPEFSVAVCQSQHYYNNSESL